MIMNLYRAIDRSQYQFEFVYLTDKECSFDSEIESMGGVIHRIPKKHSKSVFFRTFKIYQLIKKDGGFHAVHCHQLFGNGFHLLAGFLAGVKKRIAHSHSTNYLSKKSFSSFLYTKFSKYLIDVLATDYIACGEQAGNFLFKPKRKAVFIPNAIDIKKFLKSEHKIVNHFFENDTITSNTILFSQIGRFMPVKNHEFSIELCSFLKQKDIDFHLFFAGSGILENKLREIVEQKELSKNITFLGVRNDIEMVLANTDILLMPSLYEGFPVTLVESQASGTPALISEGISKEVDLGLNMVTFCSLESSYDVWLNQIKKIKSAPIPSSQEILDKLRLKGFDIEISVKMLERIYD
nr:glycosyltransferase [Aquimarina sp. U1-2]